MSTRQERIEVFQDTLNWIENDIELSASVIYSKEHTKIYWEDDYPEFDSAKAHDTEITVTQDRSYQAAMRLAAENEGSRIAVMNFANAFHAGGGVVKGASAQEECLCRTSTLYPLLYQRTLRDTFYKHHHTLKTPKATDALIYTEDVVICKTDEDLPRRMPREQWVNVDVITVAAPDLRDKVIRLSCQKSDPCTYMCSRTGCRYFGIGCIWLRRVPERPGSGGASLQGRHRGIPEGLQEDRICCVLQPGRPEELRDVFPKIRFKRPLGS